MCLFIYLCLMILKEPQGLSYIWEKKMWFDFLHWAGFDKNNNNNKNINRTRWGLKGFGNNKTSENSASLSLSINKIPIYTLDICQKETKQQQQLKTQPKIKNKK